MVGHIFRLRVLALTADLRAGRRVGLAWSLVGAALLCWSSVRLVPVLRGAPPDVAGVLATALGGVLLLGCLLLPSALAVDDPLDPRRFRGLGLDPTMLATTLLGVGTIGLPLASITIVAVVSTGIWTRGSAPLVIAVVAALLVIVSAALLVRIGMALAALALADRRRRELLGVGFLAIAVALILPASVALRSDPEEVAGALLPVANVVSWTPFGAAWAAPAEAAFGGSGRGIGRLLVAGGWVVVLAALWRASVSILLSAPEQRAESARASSLGWFGRFPATPLWAVAARSATYWVRDPRYRVQLGVLPIVSAVVLVVLLIGGADERYLALLPLPIMSFLLGWSPHNDLAFDNTAYWLHLSAGVRGYADRIGRIVPALVVGAVLIAVGTPLSAAAYGDDLARMPLAAVSSCLLLAGLGVSSFFSAAFPYPAVRPGGSPFTQPQAPGGSGIGAQALSFVLPLLVSATPVLMIVRAHLEDESFRPASDLATLIGASSLVVGVALGAVIVDHRGPELLAFTQRT